MTNSLSPLKMYSSVIISQTIAPCQVLFSNFSKLFSSSFSPDPFATLLYYHISSPLSSTFSKVFSYFLKYFIKKLLTFLFWCGILNTVDTARWSSGQDVSLSRWKHGFDSRTGHQNEKAPQKWCFFILSAHTYRIATSPRIYAWDRVRKFDERTFRACTGTPRQI